MRGLPWRIRLGAGATGLVVGLALVLVAGGMADAQAPALRVSMYGDSVMLGARDDLLLHFAGQQVTVDAVEDRSLLGAVSLLRAAGPSLGDVVVLDLGYNDGDDAAVFRGRIDDAMNVLSGVKRVIWLNQREWRAGRAGMNAELVAAASRYPNLEVVDWNAEVAAHPEDVYADGIHLTTSGRAAIATLVRQHYDAYVTSITPTTTTAPPPTTVGSRPHPVAGPRAAASDGTPGFDDRDLALAVVAGALAAGGAALGGGQRWSRVRERTPRRRAARAARQGR